MERRPRLGEVRVGRLFTHAKLGDSTTGGPLYCRVLAVDGDHVVYEAIHHNDDGSERIGRPWRLPAEVFFETLGDWSDRDHPPEAVPRGRSGEAVPLPPKKVGGRRAGS